jgi:hypothetical protein
MTETQEKRLKKAIKDLLMRLIRKVESEKPIEHKHKLANEFTEVIMYEIVILDILKNRKDKGV